jgi:hypothetical protein
MCLLVAVMLAWWIYPSSTFNDHGKMIYIGAVDGECTVYFGISGPHKKMPCPMVAKYLRDGAGLPVGATVGVGLFGEDSRHDYLDFRLEKHGLQIDDHRHPPRNSSKLTARGQMDLTSESG